MATSATSSSPLLCSTVLLLLRSSSSPKLQLSQRNGDSLLRRNLSSSSLRCSIPQFNPLVRFPSVPSFMVSKRRSFPVCFCGRNDDSRRDFRGKETGLDWPILKRWNVPWKWQTVILTMLACGLRQFCFDRIGGGSSSAISRTWASSFKLR
ncbi:hypothetical protein Sjap_015690 [Stephania japonica]|uniref:Uncharacterized protein n=1 Tax=Stephania japonica TaxID=461633 RepID=A0AAP0IJS1_9MAGN